MAGQLFISYSRRDDAAMRRIVAFLREKGLNIWVDNENLVPGTPIWEEEIEKAIHGASAVVVVLSPDSKNSVWVRREISFAERYQKRLFPIMVAGDEDSSITLRLITSQYVDIRVNEETGLDALSAAISFYLGELEKQEKEEREMVESEAAEKAAREKTEQDRKERERLEREEKARKEKVAVEKATKKKVKHEAAVIAVREKAEQERKEREPLTLKEKARNGYEEIVAKPFFIDVSWIQSKWISILSIALGWAISGVIGGKIAAYLLTPIMGSSLRGGGVAISLMIGFSIGLSIGGAVIAFILRREKLIFQKKDIFWMISSWVIGGATGGLIGSSIIGLPGIFLIGLPIGFSTGGVITTLTLQRKEIIPGKKSLIWTIMSWVIAGVIGGAVYYLVTISTGFSIQSVSIIWSIIEAVCGTIGGFVMIWQIRSAENVVHEQFEQMTSEKTTQKHSKREKIASALENFFPAWQGRILLGVIFGLIVSILYPIGGATLIFPLVCGLSGLITYPRKLSIYFLIFVFFATAITLRFVNVFYSTYNTRLVDSIAYGIGFGLPIGAIISRVVHWINKSKQFLSN